MDLSTRYLGQTLSHPFIAGASPLASDVDGARRLEDGGAAAVVLHSLFEEQVTMDARGEIRHRDVHDTEFARDLAHFPDAGHYLLTPDEYLGHIRRLKTALHIPVIASLNGTTAESWLRIARQIQQAGADALEINIYDIVSDPRRSAMSVESELRDLVVELKRELTMPIAMKLSPYYTALGNLAHRLDQAGVDGLVLFNRFYQPDIDLETLTIAPGLELSTSAELRVRLQWTALLRGRLKASLAVSGGVLRPEDGIKALLAGADAVQMVSVILKNGAAAFGEISRGLVRFMEQHQFDSVGAIKGLVSFADTNDPATFQRANYIRTLQSWTKEQPSDSGRRASGPGRLPPEGDNV